ncbi:putative proteasome subunit beta type-7 [Nosema granulosis]|uniref:Proteasome subunit beta n=1 Tax=Nosema granulosis TaxID=83296 RepID=A0A9P6KZF8_9MICR|nr:putative proteasome subunit beta type-7 [Nosema granulosis]
MRNFVISSGYIAFKFKDGIIMACDTQGSYGSLAKYRDIRRLVKLSPTTLSCFAGEVSDCQNLIGTLQMIIEEDKQQMSPSGFHRLTQRIIYKARSRMEPYNVSVVIGGLQKDTSNEQVVDEKGRVLGGINHLGNPHFSEAVSTGMASYIALPFLRSIELSELSREEAIKVAEEALRIMCYRSTRNSNRIQIGVVDSNGVEISEPYTFETKWEMGLLPGEQILM